MPTQSPQPPLPDGRWRERFRRRLRTWYKNHARDLPWRRSRDPYLVWISEIMLQQTQVATVEGYFNRFRHTFPTVQMLAAADEQAVLRLWEGLGYYRRARQLHAAAQIIVDQHEGRFPSDFDAALRLPGIGRYTAGAILSIAFDARQPILEANTVRLFSRLLASHEVPESAAGQRLLWAMAQAVLPRRDVGTFNQALMEVGSQVCTKTPDCDVCPVGDLCEAKRLHMQHDLPVARPTKKLEDVHEVALIVRRRGRVLLLRRPQGGRWAGLWDFPRYEMDHEQKPALQRRLGESLLDQTGVSAVPTNHLKQIKHGVTRFRITLDCYETTTGQVSAPPNDAPEMKWVLPKQLNDYPLSTTGRKLARLITSM
jgi:A/G-specific adenine glycosylase